MSHESLADRLRALESQLRANPKITVTESLFNPPASPHQIEQARRVFPVCDAMAAFYGSVNGLRIRWERKSGKKIATGGQAVGSINLLPIQEVFRDWKGVVYFDADDPNRRCYPFDFFVEEACGALDVGEAGRPRANYLYLGERARSLNVDFAGYGRLLLQSRGFWYWQTAVAQPKSVEAKNFADVMPELFDDFVALDADS